MDRLFLDANVLFSAAWTPTNPMRRFWLLPRTQVEIVTSEMAAGEARRNLPPSCLPDLTTPPPAAWRPLPGAGLPPKDEPIFQAAITVGATHFLTGDRKHFRAYFGQTIYGVLVLEPADYAPAASISP